VLLVADTLPGENVLEVCREAIHIHPRVAPVILARTSRHRDPEYLHQVLDMGVCDVIQVEPPYADLRYQHVLESVMQAYNLIQERISGIGGGIGRVITLFSMKGGVGKSTIAANLAGLLWHAEQRRRVVLADLNWRFGSLDSYIGHIARQSVLDLIPVLDAISRNDLESIAPPVHGGVRLLPAPLDIERTEFTRDLLERDLLEDDRATLIDDLLVQIREDRQINIQRHQVDYLEMMLKKEKVKQIVTVLARRTLQSLRRNFHYIVADTNSNLDDVTFTALELSDLILLVCTPDVPSIRATRAAVTLLSELGINQEHVAIVLNRTARRSEITTAEVCNLFSDYELLADVPADFATLQPFINTGALLHEAPLNSAPLKAMQKLAQRIVDRVPVARAA
jgi:pilus assembly protein CpaE